MGVVGQPMTNLEWFLGPESSNIGYLDPLKLIAAPLFRGPLTHWGLVGPIGVSFREGSYPPLISGLVFRS